MCLQSILCTRRKSDCNKHILVSGFFFTHSTYFQSVIFVFGLVAGRGMRVNWSIIIIYERKCHQFDFISIKEQFEVEFLFSILSQFSNSICNFLFSVFKNRNGFNPKNKINKYLVIDGKLSFRIF